MANTDFGQGQGFLAGGIGAGLQGALGQSQQSFINHQLLQQQQMRNQSAENARSNELMQFLNNERPTPKPKPQTIREELQSEIDGWLEDIK